MTELLTLLKQIIGQKLVGITEDAQGYIHLCFENFEVITKEPYLTPTIGKIFA
jgi:hypothetical protein